MVIYPDVVFFENLLVDFVLLCIFVRLADIKTSFWRIVAGSITGAIVSVFYVVWLYKIIWYIIPELAAAVMMLFILGVRGDLVFFIKKMFLLFGIGILLAGIVEFVTRGKITIWKIIMATVLFGCLAMPIVRAAGRYIVHRNTVYSMRIFNGNRSVQLKGLYDTGNRLVDPYNGNAVNIIEKEALGEIVNLKSELNMRFIPFQSLGKKDGIMQLIRLEGMVVNTGHGEKIIKNVEFGVYDGNVSADGSYKVILSSSIFQSS